MKTIFDGMNSAQKLLDDGYEMVDHGSVDQKTSEDDFGVFPIHSSSLGEGFVLRYPPPLGMQAGVDTYGYYRYEIYVKK